MPRSHRICGALIIGAGRAAQRGMLVYSRNPCTCLRLRVVMMSSTPLDAQQATPFAAPHSTVHNA